MARTLGVPLVELMPTGGRVSKYVGLLVRTTAYLLWHRPSCVIAQCPSVVLGLWTLALKPALRYALIVDLHNEAVDPYVHPSGWNRRLLRRLHRGADLSIVTNRALLALVEANGGRVVVLPDRIPTIADGREPDVERSVALIVFICTFAPDEPYLEVFESARRLTGIAEIYVTGDHRRAALPAAVPPNVRLTGFLPDAAYDRLLAEAQVVMDLTAMENCLVCGAYEAVALGKPLVTSDTAALRAFLPAGTLFTRHDPDAISAAIKCALERRADLAREMADLRAELEAAWESHRAILVERLRTLNGGS